MNTSFRLRLYMLFTSTGQSKKDYQKFQDAHRRLRTYTEQPTELREELKRADVDVWSQANYLYHAAGMPCNSGAVTYYYEILKEKAAQGIKVYLIGGTFFERKVHWEKSAERV